MNEPQNKELPILYKNYLKTCRLLELAGGVILIGAVLLNSFLHLETRGFVIPAALIGAVILALGASSIRPQNQIKAFAVQLYRTPIPEMAEALLAALRAAGTVRLPSRHHAIMTAAIDGYHAAPDSDPELAAQLSAAAEQCVKKGFLP